MMKNFVIKFSLLLLSVTLLISCSSTEETQVKNKEVKTDSVYIFDEIPPEDLFKLESPVQQSVDVYVVQIGAFSSIDRAKEFAELSRYKLNKEIKVEYKSDKNLYVVWIYPPFEEKQSAVEYRNKIQLDGDFTDAWITTIESKK